MRTKGFAGIFMLQFCKIFGSHGHHFLGPRILLVKMSSVCTACMISVISYTFLSGLRQKIYGVHGNIRRVSGHRQLENHR